jgi:fimbrial isopeptide formation D2 family protein
VQICGTANVHPLLGPPCDNEDRDAVDVLSSDVSISKALNPAVAQAVEGDSLTYDVTVAVGAGSPASGVVITDTVDAEQTITSASVGGGYNCTETGTPAADVTVGPGNTATCTLDANVPAGSNVVLTVNADVVSSADGNCENDSDVTFADPITLDSNTTSIPCFPPSVRMQKDATLDEDLVITDEVNLFLCVGTDSDGNGFADEDGNDGPELPNANCEAYDGSGIVNNGKGHLVVFERLFNQLDADGAGAFEFQLKFDHKIFDIEIFHGVDLNGDGDCEDGGEVQAQDTVDACYLYQTGRVPNWPGGVGGCDMSIINENFILFGCVSKNPQDINGDPIPTVGPIGASDVVATIHISPEPDLAFRLTPGQKNGVLRTILDENCEVADVFGDPLGSGQYDEFNREIPLIGIVTGGLVEICDDLTVTTRILEGDLNLDCQVDVADDQEIAFRYGSFFGNLLYDPWFDLEPSLKDFDVDIKDLQKVFGRNGSDCAAPIPDQAPQGAGGFNGNPDPGPLP